MALPTDQVPILRVHLEEIYDALDWARSYVRAGDIAEASRQCKPLSRSSRLDANLGRAIDHVEAYLVEEEATDGSEHE